MFANTFYNFLLDNSLPILGILLLACLGLLSIFINYILPKILRAYNKKTEKK